ncbi:Amino acid permease [Fimbriiglobus ruber]|uniref:Amino acid permease n=1 Tax=Fimbriiglobus ruber TaxID=1908690 RepID=A0A225DPQ5_9BACT|nr:Amino acid permease [Fimbriiglobus ruber]
MIGTVIGSGVFKKAHVIAENVPDFGLAVAAWVLGGVLMLLGALAYAEVAVRYPRTGGNYVFLKEGYGLWAGFLWGWVDFGIIRSASIGVLASMAIESLHDIVKQVNSITGGGTGDVLGFWVRQVMTVAVIGLLTAINIRGTRLGAGVQFVLTVLKVGSLFGLIVLPIVVLLTNPDAPAAPSTRNMTPTWPADWGAVRWGQFGVALVGVLWAYQGWMNIGPMAAEVVRPGRNIPLSLLIGTGVITLGYVGANVAYFSMISATEMAGPAMATTPVATEFCFRLIGPVGALVASLIVMTSAIGALNGNVLVAPRLLYAMAEDGLAPAALKRLLPIYQTPGVALIVFSAWSCALVIGLGALTAYRLPVLNFGSWNVDLNLPPNKVPFDVLTDYAIFGSVVFETMAVATLFRFRSRDEAGATSTLPYRCPFYPLVPAVYVLVMAVVALNMFNSPEQRSEATIGLGYIAVGAVTFAIISPRRSKRQP